LDNKTLLSIYECRSDNNFWPFTTIIKWDKDFSYMMVFNNEVNENRYLGLFNSYNFTAFYLLYNIGICHHICAQTLGEHIKYSVSNTRVET